MIVEYAPNGNLREFLEKQRNNMKQENSHYVPDSFGMPPKMTKHQRVTYVDLITFAYQVLYQFPVYNSQPI